MEKLPVLSLRKEICDLYHKNRIMIIVGETGSGKTTQIPQIIYGEMNDSPKGIAITQPRRVAATSLAKRVSKEMGQANVGQLVGYSVRFDEMTSEKTRIKYLTDGMLLKESLSASFVQKYHTIIIDEAHERTLRSDVMFGLLKMLIDEGKTDLKVIIMSATLDIQKFKSFFSSSALADSIGVLRIPGRQFPVRQWFCKRTQSNYIDSMIQTILQVHCDHQSYDDDDDDDENSNNNDDDVSAKAGDILAFLPGQDDIQSIKRILEDQAKMARFHYNGYTDILVKEFYSSLSPALQEEVFQAAPKDYRKVILSTNLAETSLTIPNVRYVIDSGYCKMKMMREGGVESLRLMPISKSSARQRSGRAGREGPGECWRLYTEETFNSPAIMPMESIPEILRVNLSSVILLMLGTGIVKDVLSFPYLDAPSKESLLKSLQELLLLDAIERPPKQKLTKIGHLMAQCPLSPTLSRSLVDGMMKGDHGVTESLINMFSLLSALDSSGGSAGLPALFKSNSQRVITETGNDDRDDDSVDFEHKKMAMKPFYHESGDHIMLLRIMQKAIMQQHNGGGGGGGNGNLSKWCKDNSLEYKIIKVAFSIRRQLLAFATRYKQNDAINTATITNDTVTSVVKMASTLSSYNDPMHYKEVLKSLLVGYKGQIAFREGGMKFVTKKGDLTVMVHPSSSLHNINNTIIISGNTSKSSAANTGNDEEEQKGESTPWIYHELLFTTKCYMRIVSKI